MNILKKITNNISKVIIGKDESIELAAIALIAKGHILLEDVPGTGKQHLRKVWLKAWTQNFKEYNLQRILCPEMLLVLNILM